MAPEIYDNKQTNKEIIFKHTSTWISAFHVGVNHYIDFLQK